MRGARPPTDFATAPPSRDTPATYTRATETLPTPSTRPNQTRPPIPQANTRQMAQPYEPVDGSASPRRKRILVALAATAVLFVGAVAVYGTPSSTLEDFKKDKEKMWAPELEKQYRECATAQRYRNEHVKAVHDSPVASLFEYSTLQSDVIKEWSVFM